MVARPTVAPLVDVALAILRTAGLRRVTMRRIAAALDTGQASPYVYIRNTEDLHAQLLDALLRDVATRFAWGLEVLITGILSTRRPLTEADPTAR